MDVDTIAAVATAPGPGALAIVRVSGPSALAVLARVAPSHPGPAEPRRASLVRVVDPSSGAELDRALVTFFPGPASYTGEDVIEISGHGGWLAPALVLEACVSAGARRAEAGEFTRRAYLNGKMDLLQAEAVLDLIEGRSRALHSAALHQLERGLSARITALRARLIHLEAMLAHHLDFPEEDEPPVSRGRIMDEARDVAGALARILATAPEGELLREGALTVLAGRPNAGKSSLFNALLGEERTIVTDTPGTTRDAVEATLSLGDFPFRLVDTAGVREPGEPVERLGMEVAKRYHERADVVLFCIEAGRAPDEVEAEYLADLAGRRVILVRTKADLAGRGEPEPVIGGSEVRVSVVTGEGLDALKALLPALVYRDLAVGIREVPVLTRARQTAGVKVALEEVEAFVAALGDGVAAEVAATHLRPGETALEELLGVISPDDVLDRLFGEFCIGK